MADPIPREALVGNRRSHQLLLHLIEGQDAAAERLVAAVPAGLDLELLEYSLSTLAPGTTAPDVVDPRARVLAYAADVLAVYRRVRDWGGRVPDQALAFNFRATAARMYAAGETVRS